MWTVSTQCFVFGSIVDADRVVEVLGVGRVDGDDEFVGEVLAAGEVVLGELRRDLPGFGQRLLRERLGQAERPDDRERIDARLAVRAEDLGDDALAAFVGRSGTAASR